MLTNIECLLYRRWHSCLYDCDHMWYWRSYHEAWIVENWFFLSKIGCFDNPPILRHKTLVVIVSVLLFTWNEILANTCNMVVSFDIFVPYCTSWFFAHYTVTTVCHTVNAHLIFIHFTKCRTYAVKNTKRWHYS